MAKHSLPEQFEMLRVQFEYALPAPSVIVVSSARSDDGKRVAVTGLSTSMQSAGYDTLLVNADPVAPRISGASEPGSALEVSERGLERFTCKTSRAGPDVMVVSNEAFRQGASRESIATLFSEFRDTYQYVFIDAATILGNNLALLFAVAADGVILTVREGRRVCTADRQLAAALQREEAKIAGVVSITPATIRAESATVAFETAWHPKPSPASTVHEVKQQQQAMS